MRDYRYSSLDQSRRVVATSADVSLTSELQQRQGSTGAHQEFERACGFSPQQWAVGCIG